MARLRLDDNEAAFLQALREQNVEAGEEWVSSRRLLNDAVARGAAEDVGFHEAFDVMTRLSIRGLVDDRPGSLSFRVFAINAAGKEALEQLHEEGRD